jgi:hypothetical protein
MPTKKTTTNTYNPQSLSQYGQLGGAGTSTLLDFMQNPLSSMFFNLQNQMAQKGIGQQQQSQVSTLMNNSKQFGSGGSNPYLQSILAQAQRSGSGQSANALNQLLINAGNLRFSAAGQGLGYQPLQTGGTQQTTGLGTWLPQLAGGALGMLSGGLGGSNPLSTAMGSLPTGGTGTNTNPFAGAGGGLSPMTPPGLLPPQTGGNNSMYNGISNPYIQ